METKDYLFGKPILCLRITKKVFNQGVKLRNYTFSKTIWLNSKYIKVKRNQKLKNQFFQHFFILYPVCKQVYKLKLFKKYQIYNVFNVSLLEQDNTRKGRVIKKSQFKQKPNNKKKYWVKTIQNSKIYINKVILSLSNLYFLIFFEKLWQIKNHVRTTFSHYVFERVIKDVKTFQKLHIYRIITYVSGIALQTLYFRKKSKMTLIHNVFNWDLSFFIHIKTNIDNKPSCGQQKD